MQVHHHLHHQHHGLVKKFTDFVKSNPKEVAIVFAAGAAAMLLVKGCCKAMGCCSSSKANDSDCCSKPDGDDEKKATSDSLVVVRRESQNKTAFVLLITLKFHHTEQHASFLEKFKALAEYVATKELGTIGYELAVSDKEPSHVVIMERYVDRDAYAKVHRTSEAYKRFKQETAVFEITNSGHSYIESNLGFI
jgi:quinol monooxygenase YgiN